MLYNATGFFWYVKSLLFAIEPEAMNTLGANITPVDDEILPELLENVFQNNSGQKNKLWWTLHAGNNSKKEEFHGGIVRK